MRGYLGSVADYVQGVTSTGTPLRDALRRQDVAGFIAAQLSESQDVIREMLNRDLLSPSTVRSLESDLRRAHGTVAALRGAVLGSGKPVREAVEEYARKAALRVFMTVQFADRHGPLLDEIRNAPPGALKRWKAHVEKPTCCHWCRSLHGVTIGVNEDFAPRIAGPAALSSTGKLTQPPRPYLGRLLAPPLHPHCECDLEVVSPGQAGVPSEQAGKGFSALPFLASSSIRSMSGRRYKLLIEFIRAAAHELGAVLRRLAGA